MRVKDGREAMLQCQRQRFDLRKRRRRETVSERKEGVKFAVKTGTHVVHAEVSHDAVDARRERSHRQSRRDCQRLERKPRRIEPVVFRRRRQGRPILVQLVVLVQFVGKRGRPRYDSRIREKVGRRCG